MVLAALRGKHNQNTKPLPVCRSRARTGHQKAAAGVCKTTGTPGCGTAAAWGPARTSVESTWTDASFLKTRSDQLISLRVLLPWYQCGLGYQLLVY